MTTFNDLPIELRLEIWSYFILPRLVKVDADTVPLKVARTNPPRTRKRQEWQRKIISSSSKVPLLLQINQETRAYGLQHYGKLSCLDEQDEPYVWVNFNQDVVEINPYYLEHFQHCGHRIRRLQFSAEEDTMDLYYARHYHLSVFCNLIQCFVVAEGGWEDFEHVHFVMDFCCAEDQLYIVDAQIQRALTYSEFEVFKRVSQSEWHHFEPTKEACLAAGRAVPNNLVVDWMYDMSIWCPADKRLDPTRSLDLRIKQY